jgi:hypothetical protein
MSNKQVAEYILKRTRPNSVKGVVFLDERDRKMILVRQTMRVVELEDSGIGPDQRYAFYDQIHTTGMDIKHKHDAKALVTIGKDMVLRDYGQGAYRMRGIGKGQRIHLLIIPEVYQLISRELSVARSRSGKDQGSHAPSSSSSSLPAKGNAEILKDVMAWLVINTCRSERLQYNQLQIQDVANVWRLRAFQRTVENVGLLAYELPSRTKLQDSYKKLIRSIRYIS